MRIDDDVPLHPNNDGEHDQDKAPPFGVPLVAESPGRRAVRKLPARNRVRIDRFTTRTRRNLNPDEVLVSRWRTVPSDQCLEHRRGVSLRSVDNLIPDFVPSSGDPSGTLGAEDGPSTLRVADSIRPEGLAEAKWSGQTATPASARQTRFSTASAPGEDASATSRGDSPSSNGCGRNRKSRIRGTSP